MNLKNSWRSLTSLKLLTIMVILIWVISLVIIIAGLIFSRKDPVRSWK